MLSNLLKVTQINQFIRGVKSTNTGLRRYGTECSDIIVNGIQGRLIGIDPDVIENCAVCNKIFRERLGYHNGEISHLQLVPWEVRWLEFHDKEYVDYEDDLLQVCGKVPYTSCGNICCNDLNSSKKGYSLEDE